ncbi:WD40 repeat-like protein [Gonapodya prolifera JEL478]|uniref:WD40 repeat-like protein n=1 Tax=Gonapodya prolifera (strain JEL478) TaxID=1344416 RepID=A0A139A2D6_GONPJ|nr:WD40 repeat-like protein [Gonapodya prolifera JEL478]|eukprot:KXS10911.1 WD40 repeat-like protein [Gonapodya prolifera JEL478]
MPDKFFQGQGKKRKRVTAKSKSAPRTPRAPSPDVPDSESDEGSLRQEEDDTSEGEDDSRETATQKRVRLAKEYLRQVERDVAIDDDEIDAEAIDRELIQSRLKADLLGSLHHAHRNIAEKIASIFPLSPDSVRSFRGGAKHHHLSVTGVCVARPSAPTDLSQKDTRQPVYLYSCSKDASIIKWDFYTGKRLSVFEGGLKPTKKLQRTLKNLATVKTDMGHCDEILCIDASDDGSTVVTGGRDKLLCVWSVLEDKMKGKLKHHRDAVSSLSFRRGHTDLYSASLDRTVKLWNIPQLSYVDTLFGHQDSITSLSALYRDRCLTAGSRDRTMRLWKTAEESQLVFRSVAGATTSENADEAPVLAKVGRKKKAIKEGEQWGSLDVVCMLNEEHFLSGSDSGAISLWNISRKKPVFTMLKTHDPKNPDADQAPCNWITALACVPHSDVFASGSCDGLVKIWKVEKNYNAFHSLGSVNIYGFVNDLTFFYAPSSSGTDGLENQKKADDVLHLAVATGCEHRLGRWWRLRKGANAAEGVLLNAVYVIKLA